MNTATDLKNLDKALLHPFTDLRAHEEKGPFIINRGEGVYVYDDNDKRYLEGMSGLWCSGLGFSEPRLAEAAARQFERLPYTHLFTHRSNDTAIQLADKLVSIAPESMCRAFLVNSGSEAVDTAVKIAWFYHIARGDNKRKSFIARKRAYHGVTVAAGSLACLAYVHDGFDLPAIDVHHVTTPHHYRYAEENESESEFTDRLVAEVAAVIEEHGADTIAAFIAEPIMGAGGVIVPPDDYFRKLKPLLEANGILMIADEVICGFGRTGNVWGSQTMHYEPDIMTVAKQLSAAFLPIGGVLVNDKVYEGLRAGSDQTGMFGTGNTYGGHPVSCAVALEAIRIYEEDGVYENVRAMAPKFAERLQALANHPLVGNVRCRGLIGGVEIVRDKSTREQFPLADKTGFKVATAALAHGAVVRAIPFDTIGICPPMIINEEQIDELFDAVGDALNDVANQLGTG
ncbi:MAG: aspartate aminotransferase family protein [Gammaproteobacteria bacterium]|nr:MAG: aspartate aminotransferase family protein [Gammaproteobacteria bacterium]